MKKFFIFISKVCLFLVRVIVGVWVDILEKERSHQSDSDEEEQKRKQMRVGKYDDSKSYFKSTLRD